MNTVSYLFVRHQRFYFRRSVPKNLRGVFGQREIIRSLITSDLRVAQRAAIAMADLLDKLFEKISKGATLLTQEELQRFSTRVCQDQTHALLTEALETFDNRSDEDVELEAFTARTFRDEILVDLKKARMWYDLFDDCWVVKTYKKNERRDGEPVWPEKPLEAARAYIDAFLFRHPAFENVAYKSLWGDLQLLDSSIMEEAMHRCNLRGIPVLPVHDELVVQRTKKEEVRQILVSSFHKVTKSKFVGFTPKMSWSEK